MKQILVTVDTNQPLQNIRKAINMLRGVVSTTVIKEPVLTKTQKQQAFVKESLTRALQEMGDYAIFLRAVNHIPYLP